MTFHFGRRLNHRTLLGTIAAFTIIAAALTAWSLETNLAVPSATDEILRHVKFLTSPETTGRGVDTPGIKLARDYLATEFGKLGLQPGGDKNSFLQPFDVAVGVNIVQPNSLSLGNEAPLTLQEQWIPLGLSTSDKVSGPLVFAGYGITARNYDYDDYAGVDVKGKIVLVLRYEPPPKNDKSPFRKFPDASTFAALRTKANNARDHGAAGMILVDLDHADGDKAELLSTTNSLWRGGDSLVAAQVRRGVIERWLEARGVSLRALKEKIDANEKPASMAIPSASATLQVNLQERREQTANVVAILPGADSALKEKKVVIGAHYDHLGYGHFGALDRQAEGQIHPGADDNASGIAVLLDLARRLSRLPAKPSRTIVFVAFSGEELGLYGSRYFVEHGGSPASIEAMLNLDMVGRLREDRVTVFGARSGAQLSDLVNRAARQVGLTVNESDSVGRSDHMSFYTKKIPVLHFFTGTHSDYHRATDTWEKLNIEGMAKVSDLVMLTALEIANGKSNISFVSLPSRPPRESRAGGVRAYLGTVPDYGVNDTGVRLAGVSSGSPAAAAGLRESDVIIGIGNKKIQNIEDLTDALGEHQSGDEVEIEILRAGKPLKLKAVLGSRG